MNVLIHTDHNIDGRERLVAHFQGVVESALSRFSDQITTLEVHLSDENGGKGGPADKRCMKMGRKLDTTIERLRERR